jgi:uncharacterized membrane protein
MSATKKLYVFWLSVLAVWLVFLVMMAGCAIDRSKKTDLFIERDK